MLTLVKLRFRLISVLWRFKMRLADSQRLVGLTEKQVAMTRFDHTTGREITEMTNE